MTTVNAKDLLKWKGKTISDIIAPNLKLLFVGINPGLYSAATGWHFAHPGNRFWKTIKVAGITKTILHPSEQHRLLERGVGITNLIPYATATAAEIPHHDFVRFRDDFLKKIINYQPKQIVILGKSAAEKMFGKKIPMQIAQIPIAVLPNPSGLNASYRITDVANCLRELISITGN